MSDLGQLEEIVGRVYGILQTLAHDFPAKTFPRGTCSDASLLLGVYLQREGYDEITYISGNRGKRSDGSWTSHAWLEIGNIVVDITAGQFDEISTDWIVLHDSMWHQSFEIQLRISIKEQLKGAPSYLQKLVRSMFSQLPL